MESLAIPPSREPNLPVRELPLQVTIMSKRALRIPRLRVKNRQRAKPVVKNRRAAAAPRKARASATTAAPRVTTVATTMVALAIVTLFVAASTLASRPAPVAAAGAQPERLHESSDVALAAQAIAPAAAPTVAPIAVAPVVAPPAVSKSATNAAVLKSEKNRIAAAPSPTAAVSAIDEALGKIDTPELPASEPISAEPAAVSPDPGPGTVTVTGCLETSGSDQFRLTDTDGVDAPRSRNWRTGFLRKRSTSVTLIDPPNPGALRTQVGQRVAATGLLTSHDLRVKSLQTSGSRCN